MKKEVVKESPELEKIVIATIYKQNGKIHLECNQEDTKVYELYGFLRCYLTILEEDLLNQMEIK